MTQLSNAFDESHSKFIIHQNGYIAMSHS